MAFDPLEPRDLDGEWIKGMAHLSAAKKIAALPSGKKATIGGNPVRNLPGKGYRVRINDVGVNYKHPEDAARSMVAGHHLPAYKHINELEKLPPSQKTYAKMQLLKTLKAHPQFSQSTMNGGGGSPEFFKKSGGTDPQAGGVGQTAYPSSSASQTSKDVAAKNKAVAEAQAAEMKDDDLYNKGLITAEEFYAAHNKVPPSSGLHFGDLNSQAIQDAKQHLSVSAKGTAAVKNTAEPITTLKSGKSVVGYLGGMSPATAQTAFNAGSLTTTEFFAKFGVLPDGAHTSIPSMDLKIVNGIRKELGLSAFTQSDLTLKAKLATEKAAKATTSKASGSNLPSFDPMDLPPGAPAGSLIGSEVWTQLPNVSTSLSSEARSGIHNYTGAGYGSINQSLRKGLVSSSTAAIVKKLDAAFQQVSPTTKDIVVYRGVSSHDTMFGSVGSHKGGVFLDGGFVSTTVNTSTASSFGGGAFIRVIIPKGSKVIKTAGISSHASEKEIILNRGSMFEIVDDQVYNFNLSYGASTRRIITLKLVS